MVFFLVAIKVLVFALCAGAVISVLVFIPLTIYVIPYCLWVGGKNTIGQQMDKKNEKWTRMVRNATRLYGAKLTGKEPIF